MNKLIIRNISHSQISDLQQIHINKQSNEDNKNNTKFLYQLTRWLNSIKRWKHRSIPEGQIVFSNNITNINEKMYVNDIEFVIPRKLEDIIQDKSADFERAKRIIRRMDEYLISPEEHNEAKRQRHQDTSLGLLALADATNTMQKVAFREVLSVDETLPDTSRRISEGKSSIDNLFRQSDKVDPITDFQDARDLIEFDEGLLQHRKELLTQKAYKPSDMLYLKCCLMIELQRDENESCLRIILHDIIFKFHLSEFRLRCEIQVRKPIEHELILEKTLHGSHLKTNYSAQFILWSGDWIVQQDVELFIVMKIESLSINKYMGTKFYDATHLHVKNVPHGSSRVFLRELTPVCRPYKLLSRGINVGQVEIEATHSPDTHQLSIKVVKVSHSQAERLLREPETYVEVIFQGPFDIYDIKRTKIAERSLNPKFNEEFIFLIPDKTAISDITIDLIFLEKSSLYYRTVLGVLTLTKHTDFFPVRKFWDQLEQNPNIKLINSFIFEGNVDEYD